MAATAAAVVGVVVAIAVAVAAVVVETMKLILLSRWRCPSHPGADRSPHPRLTSQLTAAQK